MSTRNDPSLGRGISVLGILCALLVGVLFAPCCTATEDYLSVIPEDVQACARALAWSSGYRHITHRDEQWDAREHAPRETCQTCGGAPMCVVCMEYDLESYNGRPGVTSDLRGCLRTVQRYLRSATRQETQALAALYWTAYWDGRHNRPVEPRAEEGWNVVSPTTTADGEAEFATPFILGISSLRVGRIADAKSGNDLAADSLTAEFVFEDEATALLGPADLRTVIFTADGYASEVVAEFTETETDTPQGTLVHLTPEQDGILLMPLTSGGATCKVCTVVLEILSDNGSTVKARLLHCGENGRWEQWFKGDIPRRKTAPPKECRTCTYWLRYEQVETKDQNNNPMSFGKYTLFHCKPDNHWEQVYVHTATKVSALPKGRCTPGQEVILVTEFKRGKRTYVRHDLCRCNSKGQWVRIGGWIEPKSE